MELPRRNSDAAPKKATPEEVLKAPISHQDGQTQGGPNGPKDKETEGKKSGQAPKTPYVAVTTGEELRALDRDMMTRRVAIQRNRTSTIDKGSKRGKNK